MKSRIWLILAIIELAAIWYLVGWVLALVVFLWTMTGLYDAIKDTIAHHYPGSRLKIWIDKLGLTAHDWGEPVKPSGVWWWDQLRQSIHDMSDDVWHRAKMHMDNCYYLFSLVFAFWAVTNSEIFLHVLSWKWYWLVGAVVLGRLYLTHIRGCVFHAFYLDLLLTKQNT